MGIFPSLRKKLSRSHKSTQQQDDVLLVKPKDILGGVFVSTKSVATTCYESSSSSQSSIGIESPSNWRPSDSHDHNRNVPLIVSDPANPRSFNDAAEELGRIVARSRHLPSTSYFASNHIMVNKARSAKLIAPLYRLTELDEIARQHADKMAAEEDVFHSSPSTIQEQFHRPCRRLGENVAKGADIHSIHAKMLQNTANRNNMLDRRFTHMGMATSRGSDGSLYLCQVFGG